MSSKSRLEKKWRRKTEWVYGMGWTHIMGKCWMCNQMVVLDVAASDICWKGNCVTKYNKAMEESR